MQLSTRLNINANRADASVLLVSANLTLGSRLRQVLADIGFSKISFVNNHIMALDRLMERRFDIIMFDARPSNMPSELFVKQAMKVSPASLFVAVSNNVSIDDVFTMLRYGARGFLRLPMSVEQVERVLVEAATAPPFSQAILQAADRDRALAIMVLNCLYRLAETLRHARAFPGARAEVERYSMGLADSMNLARTFSLGGDDSIREKICEECCIRADRPATRLGRTRLKLKHLRNSAPALEAQPF
jgi:DNA-binding NarL/FixJ family response regulator